MSRATIDFGIDLGTTNSAIGVLKGTEVEVFRNNENFEYTPSAVWIDKSKRLIVGRGAKEKLDIDPENAFCEFKLQMGTAREYHFARSGRVMRAEELSAEVLKSLKENVKQRAGEEVRAAVITVPAAFELPQCEATRKAAELAGFSLSPLLQEPVAAALAYGFQSESDKVFWLVYDLGGGTFDAAVMQVRDGVIQVVNHGGDNHLGGKLIDWAIVEQLLIPAVTQAHHLSDFRRGNPKWAGAIAKLKQEAEKAKISLSRDESVEITIDYLCSDGRGEPVRFEYDLQRGDLERLAEPFILRSINICRKVLTEKRLGAGNVEKLLLVGGPTLMPYLRERLADRNMGLGIPLEFTIDPLTVVACGAAVFAGTQRLAQEPAVLENQREQGRYTISFSDWKFKGSDTEPMVAGVVSPPAGQALRGLTVEFINNDARPAWRSGKLNLSPNGAFMTTLWAEKGHPNTFQIELRDSAGTLRQVATDPHPLTYTVGLVIDNPPLIHSLGVALANNEVYLLMEKGSPLPARKLCILRTAIEVRQGQAGDVIRIPVVEGGNSRADRNQRIGILEVKADKVRRSVPIGSEVEFTLVVDESRIVRAKAYIPILDEEYEEVLQLGKEAAPDPQDLRKEAEREKQRLEEVRQKAEELNDPLAQQALQRIEGERIEHEVDASVEAAPADPDAADKAEKRLLDLKGAIDQVEEALEWPSLVAEAENMIAGGRDIVAQYGDPEDRRKFQTHEAEVRNAMRTRDVDLLRQRVEELRGLGVRILDRKGILQVIYFEQLQGLVSEMRDQAQADQLIAQGQRAIQANDVEGLRAVNRQLAALLPAPPLPPDISTVMR